MPATKIKKHPLLMASYPVLIRLWKDNKRTIHKNIFLKVLLIATITSPFRWIQEILFNHRINQVDLRKNPPIFVIGHWRSGTTHLHYLLCQDKQFSFLEVFQAYFFRIALVTRTFIKPLMNLLIPSKRPQDNVSVSASSPAEEEHSLINLTHRSGLQSFFFPKNMSYFSKYTLLKTSRQNIEKWKKIYSKMLKEIALYSGKHKKIILKNPHNTARVKILKEMYPGAKFIFIHRNPYDVFSSTKHLHMTLIKEQYMQAFSEHEINELVLHCYEQMMQGYLEQRKLIGIDNLIEISYSDLNENPMKCMEKVYKKLNLKNYQGVKKYFEDYLLSQQTYRKNAFTPLSAELKANIKRRWAFAFKAWDYESS